MTVEPRVVCPNGSQIKPGLPTYGHFDANYIASIVPAESAWLKAYLPYLPPIDLSLDGLCAAEPPAFPTLDANDFISLINPGKAGVTFIAAQKITQAVHYWLWYLCCQCIGTTTPPRATGPAVPTGAPAINPPALVTLPSTPLACLEDGRNVYDNPAVQTGAVSYAALSYSVPNVRTIRAKVKWLRAGATHLQPSFYVSWISAAVEVARTPVFTPPADGVADFDFPVFSPSSRAALSSTAASGTDLYGGMLQAFCDVAPGTAAPCNCGPDQVGQGLLNQLRDLISSLQRYSVPFALVPGAVHSNLSGEGSFAVSQLIGLRVQLTQTAPGEPVLPGNPPYLWDQGWMSVSDGGAMLQELRVTRTLIDWLPKEMALATTFGYAFAPGVVATVTELEAEP